MSRLIITEQERLDILRMYNLAVEDLRRPLQKLMECKISSDGKYIVFEGRAYKSDTGVEVPINEEWSLSDILHAGADILSAGLDFVIPGSGAVVDVLNAISYIIEAQFKSDKEKDSLYIMAAITFAFVILPGPLQGIAIPLKRAVKTGIGMADSVVKKGLTIIGNALNTLLVGIPSKINSALKSPLAKNILGKWGDKISGFVGNFTTRIKSLLGSLTGKSGKEGAELAGKQGTELATKAVKEISGEQFQKNFIVKNCFNKGYCDTGNIISNFMKNLPPPNSVFNPSKVKVLNKSNVAGREIIEVNMENGQKVLFYKSSGQNVATTGKKAGEWFTIPGFANDGWFIKTNETIALTKGGNKYLTEMAQFLEKNGAEGLTKTVGKESAEIAAKASLTQTTKASLGVFLKSTPKIAKGASVLRKMGFVVGKPYRYVGKSGKATTATIKEITDNGVKVAYKNGTTTMVPVETFVKNAVGAPWMRRGYSVMVPLFVKRFADVILPDGTIDYEKLEALPDLNPDETSQESLEYLQEEVADYQGDTGKYVSNTNAVNFQNALKLLGFDLGDSGTNKDGVDGKFGPITQKALKDFQSQNGLESSSGKMDRATAKKLSDALKTKNIQGSEEIQNFLNSI